MATESDSLTVKQRKFVEELAADGNAVQAYFIAFGRKTSRGKRRSYKAAQSAASHLISKVIIQAELERAMGDYQKRVRVSKARVIKEVAALAFFDPISVFEEDAVTKMPTPRDWNDVAPAARRAIASIKIKRRKEAGSDAVIEEVEYKFAAKGAELDKLCKKLGFYKDESFAKQPDGNGMTVNIHPTPALVADEPTNR